MIGNGSTAPDSVPLSLFRQVVAACDRHEAAWRTGTAPRIEDAVNAAAPADRPVLLRKLLELELELRRSAGEQPDPDEYRVRFPTAAATVESVFFPVHDTEPDAARPAVGAGRAGPDVPRSVGGYELLGRVGEGGMGVVYRALQRAAGRVVALKLIRPGLLDGLPDSARDELVARFTEESRAAAGLEHDHIVTVYDVGVADGRHYYAMQFIDGPTLADLVAKGPLPNGEAAALLEPVARAVHYAHTHGILHRDLKPRNVLIAGGRPLVADFGLAKRLTGDDPRTPPFAFLGTAGYAAPEQTLGTGLVGPAADIYSLGVMLYEVLTGRPPFQSPDLAEVLRRVAGEVPVPPRRLNPSVDRDLETVCLKCLEKDPGLRYATADALADDLRRYRAGEPVRARRPRPWELAARWVRRRPATVIGWSAAAALGLALPFGLAAYHDQWQDDRAAQLVEALRAAAIEAAPGVIGKMGLARPNTVARLTALASSPRPEERLKAALALAPVSPAQSEYLFERLLASRPDELTVIRDTLRGHRDDVVERLRAELRVVPAAPDRALRAACALAPLDANAPEWAEAARPIRDRLLAENPQWRDQWAHHLAPAAGHLYGPLLAASADCRKPESAVAAAELVATFLAAADRPDVLRPLVRRGTDEQLKALASRLPDRQAYRETLVDELRRTDLPPATGSADRPDWRGRANAALVLALLRDGEALWPLLAGGPDPRLRTDLIHRLAPVGFAPELLARRLAVEIDPSIRRALILALGTYPPDAVPGGRGPVAGRLAEIYCRDPDAGVHAAAEWALRAWGREDLLDPAPPAHGMQWRHTPSGHVLAIVRVPGARRVIEIGTREVTVEQFLKFRAATYDPESSPHPDCPVNRVDYRDAVQYCRWLSVQEGLTENQLCYPHSSEGTALVGPCEGYLDRTGYRLPTEDEWRYAAMAGAETPFHFGDAEAVLRHYAWHYENAKSRTGRAGALMPNDFGFFDMVGNVSEWCEGDAPPGKKLTLGSSFIYRSDLLKANLRRVVPPATRYINFGFRIARTVRPDVGGELFVGSRDGR